ncbi:MAG: chemotaxis-specific protein-glutamate methyltransferase CheB [Deltaproteobacteria bacterium]|nr:chemotaxis-specific protein-glutamate methyltransferase CheB [Deltaproteobacteria bacterium]
MANAATRKLRVLVVDDSALNRSHIRALLSATGEAEIVGEAGDGQEALTLVFQLKPDAVTLDLEMPRMNGFTFLRLLMSKQPTPVLVISRHSEKESVFKALEFGAVDFLEKPSKWSEMDTAAMQEQLLGKLSLMRSLIIEHGTLRTIEPPPRATGIKPGVDAKHGPRLAPRHIVAIASSAGGPAALLEIFAQLPERAPIAVLVAQHMPERFTSTFAQRLENRSLLTVSEARDGDLVVAQRGFVCPGDRCMELELAPNGVDLRLSVLPPRGNDRYVPNADRLLQSVARVAGPRAVGVVLTGMGDDGAQGAHAIRRNRGTVIVESRETAVVPGMPTAAAPAAHHVLALGDIAKFLASLT